MLQFSPPLRFRANENSKDPKNLTKPEAPKLTPTRQSRIAPLPEKTALSPSPQSFLLGPVSNTGIDRPAGDEGIARWLLIASSSVMPYMAFNPSSIPK